MSRFKSPMQVAPIVLFVYNRAEHTRKTIEALKANSLGSASELTIFSDGAKHDTDKNSVLKVREYLKKIEGFKNVRIVERQENLGLAQSVISGVSEIIQQNGKAIVLEDDILTSPRFLEFMNSALNFYEKNPSIFAISGWSPPLPIQPSYKPCLYLTHRAMCWGWATWRDRWDLIDWEVNDYSNFQADRKAIQLFSRGGEDLPDMLRNAVTGKINSWAIRWAFAQFKQGRLSVAPTLSMTENIGMDGTGINCGAAPVPQSPLKIQEAETLKFLPVPVDLKEDPEISAAFKKYFSYNWKGKVKRALGLL